MRDFLALGMTALLGVAFPFPAGAQAHLPAGDGGGPCVQGEDAALSLPVTAVVSKIDLRQGRATLETSVGKLELATAPAELRALRTGDVLTLCVDPSALPDTNTPAPSSLG